MAKPFQTKVISAWDYRQMDLSQFCTPFEVDREQLAESLLSVRKKYALHVPAQTVEKGDVATLRCRSARPKFQKDSVPVTVGKGVYSKELEAQLPGLSVGDQRELTVDGTPVSVQILKVERTVLPELTDEFVASTFQSVHTFSELEKWYIDQQYEEHLRGCADSAAEAMKAQVLEKSVIDVNEEERLAAWTSGDQMLREHWREIGMPLEEMTDEQAQEIVGHPSAAAFIDWFTSFLVNDLLYAALGWELLAAEGRQPTEESYREALRKKEEDNTPPEELKAFTFSAYAQQICTEHYNNTLDEYAYQIIKEKLS